MQPRSRVRYTKHRTYEPDQTAVAGPQLLSENDLYLFNEGSHYRIYDKMGAHVATHDGQGRVARPPRVFFRFPLRHYGSPALAILARAGTMLPTPKDFDLNPHRPETKSLPNLITCQCDPGPCGSRSSGPKLAKAKAVYGRIRRRELN